MKAAIVIFGATGDLTRRKLLPALYRLYVKGELAKNAPIIGVGRKKLSKKAFLALGVKKFLTPINKKRVNSFLEHVYYTAIDFKKTNNPEFAQQIERIAKKHQCKNKYLFYLSTPPSIFVEVVKMVHSSGLINEKGWQRFAFEKPFGYDLKSARKLNKQIKKYLQEENVFRIDHYLGKELVQTILTFRFANSIFEQIWNRKFVDHVQITVSENIGVESRGNYYERTGAIRDMIQNHLLQVLSLTAMDEPVSMNADDIRNQKVKVLRALMKVRPHNIVLGQYGTRKVGNKKVKKYREEINVAPKSMTETFVAIKTYLNTKRWHGVPFYLRTGKRMKTRYAEVNIVLKNTACHLFSEEQHCNATPNMITIRIQPNEGIAVQFNAKYPGPGINLHPVIMDFCHGCLFGFETAEAYEVLLHEILAGNQTLFTRWDEVEASWHYTDMLIKAAKKKKKRFPNYKAGTNGPKEAEELMTKKGRYWIKQEEVEE